MSRRCRYLEDNSAKDRPYRTSKGDTTSAMNTGQDSYIYEYQISGRGKQATIPGCERTQIIVFLTVQCHNKVLSQD